MTGSERVQQYRRRKRNGRACVVIEITIADVADLLIDAGFLGQWDAEDRRKIAAALQCAIEVWARA